jgi:mannose-P-dolichol utilization defect protein 1
MDTIRDIVQPITKNLPPPVRDAAVSLLGEQCYQELVLNVDLTNIDCVKLGISKALGVAIVGVSAIVKVPQLINLLSSKSAAGISFLSYALETVAYLITLSYNVRMNNPFSTYGENIFIAVQNIAIATLVLHYGGKGAGAAAFVAVLGAGLYALFSEDIVDMKTMAMLQAAAGVIGVASKLPQILTIFMEGGTGQLSSFAVRPHLRWRHTHWSGLQLFVRVAVEDLYDAPGGQRPAHSLRIRGRLCAESGPGPASVVLLDAREDGDARDQGAEREGRVCGDCERIAGQVAQHSASRVGSFSLILAVAGVLIYKSISR